MKRIISCVIMLICLSSCYNTQTVATNSIIKSLKKIGYEINKTDFISYTEQNEIFTECEYERKTLISFVTDKDSMKLKRICVTKEKFTQSDKELTAHLFNICTDYDIEKIKTIINNISLTEKSFFMNNYEDNSFIFKYIKMSVGEKLTLVFKENSD